MIGKGNDQPTGPAAEVSAPGAAKGANLLSLLLKDPVAVGKEIAEGSACWRRSLVFLIWAMVFHAVFGLAVGLFGGWSVAGMTATKAPLIALCSFLLCYPSLYVFGCLGGAELSAPRMFLFGSSCLAMIGLILIGLAPVAWLFSISTASFPFVVLMTAIIWLVSVGFAFKYILKLQGKSASRRLWGIVFWFYIFVLVSFQMTTCMRPLLTKPEPGRGWWTAEKQFFGAHFASCFEEWHRAVAGKTRDDPRR
jgi:hypothetical protein